MSEKFDNLPPVPPELWSYIVTGKGKSKKPPPPTEEQLAYMKACGDLQKTGVETTMDIYEAAVCYQKYLEFYPPPKSAEPEEPVFQYPVPKNPKCTFCNATGQRGPRTCERCFGTGFKPK